VVPEELVQAVEEHDFTHPPLVDEVVGTQLYNGPEG
jgi:hypothetical protein